MRHILIAAAALAVSGFAASTAAKAQTYQAGAPVQVGNMCKVNTDNNGEMELRLLRVVRPAGRGERPAPEALSAAISEPAAAPPMMRRARQSGHGQRFSLGSRGRLCLLTAFAASSAAGITPA